MDVEVFFLKCIDLIELLKCLQSKCHFQIIAIVLRHWVKLTFSTTIFDREHVVRDKRS